MTVTYGANAVLNPGGETFTGTANGNEYRHAGQLDGQRRSDSGAWSNGNASSAAIPQPAGVGTVYFTGGPDQAEADVFQTIDISSIATDIDAGKANFALSALLGGTGAQKRQRDGLR